MLAKNAFTAIALGIIYDPKTRKILIGRREKDPYIKELSWCFPGGQLELGESPEECVKREIVEKTGLDADAKKIVFARTSPAKKEFVLLYYYCEATGGREKAADSLAELKWIRPTEVKKYFTPPVHPKVMEFLKSLE